MFYKLLYFVLRVVLTVYYSNIDACSEEDLRILEKRAKLSATPIRN